MEYRHEIKHLKTQADAIAIRNNLSAVAESDPHVKDDGDSSETKVMPQSFPQDVDFSSFMGGGNRGGFGCGGFSSSRSSSYSRSSSSGESQESQSRPSESSAGFSGGGFSGGGFSGFSSSSVSKSTWIQFGIYVLVLLAAIVVVWRLRKHND